MTCLQKILNSCRAILIIALLPAIGYSQPQNLKNYDYTYVPNIKTVIWRPTNSAAGFPTYFLESGNTLIMRFDDLDGDHIYYRYRVVQCDANWNPSPLNEIEYISGFNDQELRDYAFSANTRVGYTQYWFTFPNDNLSVTKSGNYLMHIYREDDQVPVITKRFVVAELLFNSKAAIVGDRDQTLIKSNQRIDLTVVPSQRLIDPLNQLSVSIIQNKIWSNSETLKPRFQRLEELTFDYMNKPSFPGFKDFRFLNLRSLRGSGFNVENIERYPDRIDIFMRTDEVRSLTGNISYPDLNGSFIIEDQDHLLNELSNEYSNIYFYLRSEKLENPVYVLGEFNNYGYDAGLKPMEYIEEKGYYKTDYPMKQGYYDYFYAEKLPNGRFDHSQTEGNSYESANNYHIFGYYRGFSDRYDRVVFYDLLGLPVSGQNLNGQ